VISSAYKLAERPKVGQMEPTLETMEMGHRRIIIGHFKIIYRIDEVLDAIFVTDIFDSRQNPKKVRP